MPDASSFLKSCFVRRRHPPFCRAVLAMLLFSASSVLAESCLTSRDMDDATRTALTTAALRYFDLIAKGDTATLRQGMIPGAASDFSGIETTVKDSQGALAGSRATVRPPFLLVAEGAAPIPHGNFYVVFSAARARPATALFSHSTIFRPASMPLSFSTHHHRRARSRFR
jgi:hypothetical protein